ncbi:MAG: vgr related protein [Alphaproteobacteria bacterium]|nr:vgr related protein [Alphaproteobacteria bacterium]
MIAAVFGDALSPDGLTFRRGCWWPFQPRRVVMAPDGHLWFHPDGDLWREDFSIAPLPLRALIVHELVHVWQHRQGVRLPLARGPLARYRYRLVPGRPFRRYGIEQQAEMVRDLWLHRQGAPRAHAPPAAALAAVIPFGPAQA